MFEQITYIDVIRWVHLEHSFALNRINVSLSKRNVFTILKKISLLFALLKCKYPQTVHTLTDLRNFILKNCSQSLSELLFQ